jgi:hypothetical protein
MDSAVLTCPAATIKTLKAASITRVDSALMKLECSVEGCLMVIETPSRKKYAGEFVLS